MKTPKNTFQGLLGLLGVIVVGGAGIYYMLESGLVELNDDIGKLLAEQEAITKQIQVYEEAERKIEELSFVEDLADSVLPSSKEQGNVLAEIQKFIVDAGMEFDSVTFTSGGPNLGVNISQTETRDGLSGVRALPVTAVVRPGAEYGEIIKLLETIENNQRKMQVTNLALTPEQETDNFATINIQIDVYVRAAPAPIVTDTSTEETP